MKAFLFIFFLLFSSQVFSQAKIDDKSLFPLVFENKTKILGINAILSPNFFFDRPETLPMELIYRRFNGNNQAIRVRLEGRYDKSLEENLPFLEEKWNSSLGGALGYEWHRSINQNWSWFFGAELVGTYYWLDQNYARPTEFSGISMILYLHETRRLFVISPNGFVGIFRQVAPKLFISFQQQIGISFERYNSSDIGDLNPLDPTIEDVFGAAGNGRLSIFSKSISIRSNIGFQLKF